MIIAIDGPAASGKSTLARELARELGLLFLDTGAMYRAVGVACARAGVDPGDPEACAAVADRLHMGFDEAWRLSVDGREWEAEIRTAEAGNLASRVAVHPGVRRALVAEQRAIAGRSPRGVVAEGRDTTTVVFPDADLKIFLRAGIEERARRRSRELTEKGEVHDLDRLRADIAERDRRDAERDDSPLRRAEGARLIDSDALAPAEVLALALDWARESAGDSPGGGRP